MTRAKQKHNSTKPNVTINYLQFPYNVVDEETIWKAIAQKVTDQSQMDYIDAVRIVRGTMLGSPSMLQAMKIRFSGARQWFKKVTHFKNQCLQIFLYPAVRADGAVFPCCIAAYSEDLKMGNLHDESFEEIWNTEKYSKFRSDFLTGKNEVCNDCLFHYSYLPLFRKDFFKVRLKLNLKLLVQLAMKTFFAVDKALFRGKLFQAWIFVRLKRNA